MLFGSFGARPDIKSLLATEIDGCSWAQKLQIEKCMWLTFEYHNQGKYLGFERLSYSCFYLLYFDSMINVITGSTL